jgi:hypothetical protein
VLVSLFHADVAWRAVVDNSSSSAELALGTGSAVLCAIVAVDIFFANESILAESAKRIAVDVLLCTVVILSAVAVVAAIPADAACIAQLANVLACLWLASSVWTGDGLPRTSLAVVVFWADVAVCGVRGRRRI